MEKALEASRMAPGRPCPAFTAVDAAGKSVSLKDFSGRVVLLDFWSDDWETWRRDLPQLVETYKTYHPNGFEVVGFCISPNREKALAYAAREGADWTMVPDGAPVAAKFGLYGEAGSFLVGPNGAILVRNLHGAERVNKVRGALGFDN
jgi:peroxiredoxin